MADSHSRWFTWLRTLGAMVERGAEIRVWCDTCDVCRHLDLPAFMAVTGPDYSLINRRCRCRMTTGCHGWNRFFYRQAVYRPLWNEATKWRWWFGPEAAADLSRISSKSATARR
jgi:hypothetical protein